MVDPFSLALESNSLREFEPPVPFGTSVFKSEAKLNLSTNFNNQQQLFPIEAVFYEQSLSVDCC